MIEGVHFPQFVLVKLPILLSKLRAFHAMDPVCIGHRVVHAFLVAAVIPAVVATGTATAAAKQPLGP